MSNEYKDWLRDQVEEPRETIKKYPLLQIKCNDVAPYLEEGGHEVTWLDELPTGWQYIGYRMCEELSDALGDYADNWVIIQLKEKFGRICLYWNWDYYEDFTDEQAAEMNKLYDVIEDILDKYADISWNTCAVCGSPATEHSSGWVLPYCKECYDRKFT